MPKLTIDNRTVEVPEGTKVLEAAERVGIIIPRFCYHPALGSVGACRVCAVAFKEGPVKGIQMSCMTAVQDGMVVSTTDDEAVDFRRHVIEWLMLHHPHDCPVCDEGGHCLLQDMTVSGGHGMRRYLGHKRTHVDQDLGPLVQHEMNRCIQCYRCVRYYQEYSGYRDLGVMGIGSRVYFGRSAAGRLQSPFAGNLIDICPTGVYTDKPSRYMGRRWDFERAPTVCLHCSLGCNLTVSARYRQIVRCEARPNTQVNGYFICDRGRYGYAYASQAGRPRRATVTGQAGEFAAALDLARTRLADIAARFGPQSVAVVSSSRCSLETHAVIRKACQDSQWTGPVIAETARWAANLETAVRHLTPDVAASLEDVAQADVVVVAGADPVNEAPVLALALRQARRRSSRIVVIDPRPVQLPLGFDHWAVQPSEVGSILERLAAGIANAESGERDSTHTADRVQILIDQLRSASKAVVVCGTDIMTGQDIAQAAALAQRLRQHGSDGRLFYTLMGPNAFGAGLTGGASPCMEHILERIEAGEVHALIMVESDLWRRIPDRRRLSAALEKLALRIVMDYTPSPLSAGADVFLPTGTPFETEGHWVNQEGRLQRSHAVFKGGEPIALSGGGGHPPRVFDPDIPGAMPRPAWEIVAELSHARLDLAHYLKSALREYHPDLASLAQSDHGGRIFADAATWRVPLPAAPLSSGASRADLLTLLLVEQTFGTEPLAAQSDTLAQVESRPAAVMHPQDIKDLNLDLESAVTLSTDAGAITLALTADERMARGVVVVPRQHGLDWQIVNETNLRINRSQIAVAATR